MWETMGPVASLLVLLVEGIKGAGNVIRSSRKKAIQRRIIEIKLSLDDIIENGSAALSIIEVYANEPARIGPQEVKGLQALLYRQWSLVNQLLVQVNDDSIYEILDLIGSRRLQERITELITRKGSIINEILHRLHRWDKVQISGRKMTVKILSDLPEWNHGVFLEKGDRYAFRLITQSRETEVEISHHIIEHRQNLDALEECSKELSAFIRSTLQLDDYI